MFRAALETGSAGLWYGRFVDLPGTHARARSRQGILEELREELVYHADWLRLHDEKPPTIRGAEIIVSEEIQGLRELGESGGEVALFEYDLRTVSAVDLERLIRLMAHNRGDLLKLIAAIPEERMAYTPPGKGRNITQILHHVCNAEEFYVSRMGEEADAIYGEARGMTEAEADGLPANDRLSVVRRGCLVVLRELVVERGDSAFTRAEHTKYPDERWTAHKVLRRFLEHEREHIYNIREYLGLPPRE